MIWFSIELQPTARPPPQASDLATCQDVNLGRRRDRLFTQKGDGSVFVQTDSHSQKFPSPRNCASGTTSQVIYCFVLKRIGLRLRGTISKQVTSAKRKFNEHVRGFIHFLKRSVHFWPHFLHEENGEASPLFYCANFLHCVCPKLKTLFPSKEHYILPTVHLWLRYKKRVAKPFCLCYLLEMSNSQK